MPGPGDIDHLHRGSHELVGPEEDVDSFEDDLVEPIPQDNQAVAEQAKAVRAAREQQKLEQEDLSGERRQFTATAAPPPPPGIERLSGGTRMTPGDIDEEPPDPPPAPPRPGDEDESRVEGHLWSVVAASPPPPPAPATPPQISTSWLAHDDD